MSEGETPDILDAWPMVLGLISESFCRPSEDIDWAFSYLKFIGIFIFSSLISLSAFICSFSIYPLYFVSISTCSKASVY